MPTEEVVEKKVEEKVEKKELKPGVYTSAGLRPASEYGDEISPEVPEKTDEKSADEKIEEIDVPPESDKDEKVDVPKVTEEQYNQALRDKGIDVDNASPELKKHIQETRSVFLTKTQELSELKKRLADSNGQKPVTAEQILTSPEFQNVRRDIEDGIRRDLGGKQEKPNLEEMSESERVTHLVAEQLKKELDPMKNEYTTFKKQVASDMLNRALAIGEDALIKQFGEDEVRSSREKVRSFQKHVLVHRNALTADEAYFLLKKDDIIKTTREKAYREGYARARNGVQRKIERTRPDSMTRGTPPMNARDYSGADGVERAFSDAEKALGVNYDEVGEL